jgi:hypothetical protein
MLEPRIPSWVTFSRPYGTAVFCEHNPGFRPSDSILGYFQSVLSKLGFYEGGGKAARLRLGFLQENQSQSEGAFRHEWSMQYFFAGFGGIFSSRV